MPGLPRRERPGLRRDDGVAEARPAAGRRSSTVAGWVHMSPSIAGATTIGALVASAAAVTTSPARPLAIAREPVRGRRRDDERVGGIRDDDVADPAVRAGGRGRRSRPGGAKAPRTTAARRSAGRCGESRTTTSAPFRGEQPEQLDGLVRGDRAGDAERDETPLEAARRCAGGSRQAAARAACRPRPRRGGSRGP